MVCVQLQGKEDALTKVRCLSTVSASQRRRSSQYVQHHRPPRAHRESDPYAALAPELLRHRPQGVAGHHGQTAHPPLGEGWVAEELNRHGPHSRTIDNENRKRCAARSAGKHSQTERYGFIQRKAARHGSACAWTEDKKPDQHCQKVEQDLARRRWASADVRRVLCRMVYDTTVHGTRNGVSDMNKTLHKHYQVCSLSHCIRRGYEEVEFVSTEILGTQIRYLRLLERAGANALAWLHV